MNMNMNNAQMYFAIQEDRMSFDDFKAWLEERDQDQYDSGYAQATEDVGEDL